MFFFSDDRCNYTNGRIQLQTEFPFYEPGNTINGVIYLEIFNPTQANCIEIEVKGQEKVAFTRYYMENEGDRQVERSERVKASKRFAHFKEPVYPIPGGQLAPGLYQVRFQFVLPDKMPSSINFKDKSTRERPKAKIKYFVKAVLKTGFFENNMKYKQVLAIREPPVQFKMNEQQAENANIKTWCCIDQGFSKMWANYEKNIYLPNETAKAMIHIDNSECTLNVTEVKFWVE
jgi:hypothetical protein